MANVVTIGNFDGVHIGHRAILDAAAQAGRNRHDRSQVTVLTFEPHPVSVLRPEYSLPRLMTGIQKQQALLNAGADRVVMLEPRRDLLSMEPGDFARWVMSEYKPAVIVEGTDFRFGRKRAGDTRTLSDLGEDLGFAVKVVQPVNVSLSDQMAVPVSSSLIRWLLEHGRVADAGRCMGRPYELSGVVVSGEGRGRGLGVPTLNLDGQGTQKCLVPSEGVYAGVGILEDGLSYPAAISIGRRDTFGGGQVVTEVHLLGYEGDLYGRSVRVSFDRWIRDQQQFPTTDGLRIQIGRDIALINDWNTRGLLTGT